MLEFEDLKFSRKILKRVSFFPTLLAKDGTVVGIDLKEEKALDVVVELMEDYGLPMGILFTKNKFINVIARFENDEVSVYEKEMEKVKIGELEEMLSVSEVQSVIIVEELDDNGLIILSNRYVEMEDEE